LLINWSLIAGYDFFISYKRNEAQHYAARLEQMLKRADFRCFLDDKDASPGTGLTTRLRSALRRSKALIVIGTPNVAESTWVAEEIRIFSKTRRDIIPISIGGGLKLAYETNEAFSVLRERDVLWLDEDASLDSGEPSPAVLGGLQKGFRHRRANRNLRLLGGLAIVVLAVATITAYWQKVQAGRARDQALEAGRVAIAERDNARTQEAIAKQQRDLANERLKVAESQALASDARRQMMPELKNALAMSVKAYERNPSIDAQMALLETLGRAAKIKRYFVCSLGEKATGVAFSKGIDPLMAYSCLGAGVTHIRVVDPNGRLWGHVDVSGDGRSFAFVDRGHIGISGSNDLRILSIATRQINAYHGHAAMITNVESGPEAQLFSADAAGEIRVWSRSAVGGALVINSTSLKRTKSGLIAGLLYSTNTGILHVIGSGDTVDNIVFKQNLDDDHSTVTSVPAIVESDCRDEHPPSTRYRAVAFASDGAAFAYSTESNDIIVVDGKTSGCEAILPGHTHNILAMAFSANSRELASAGAIANADDTHGVIVWNLDQLHPLAKRLTPASAVFRFDSKIALSGDGTSWACTYCGSPLVWDGVQVHLPRSVDAETIASLALAQEGQTLVVGFKDGILMFIQKPAPFRFVSRVASTFGIEKVWFADDVYAIAANGQVSIWSAERRVAANPIKKLPRNECLDVFTWGPYLPIEKDDGGEKSAVVYDLRSGSIRSTVLPSTADTCSSVAYSGEKEPLIRLSLEYAPIYLVATDGQPQIRSWDNPVRAPSGLRSVLGLARISTDGKRLFASSDGNAIVLFDLVSNRLIANIGLHLVHDIKISRDGTRVLTISEDGILIWDFNPADWKRTAAEMTGIAGSVDTH
jgi:WD40 repeat protein